MSETINPRILLTDGELSPEQCKMLSKWAQDVAENAILKERARIIAFITTGVTE